ncbi:MAG TPA: hypothetical protein VGX48_14900 [Pyrinomonadaceae bacterium]|jgi:hypothetical protein|nr:hypothetical protein [Pyrinomonadaceae bacterium]
MAASKKSSKKSAKKSAKKSSKKARGSQKMAAARGVTATTAAGGGALAKAVATLDRSRLNHDIIIRGIPIPDIIKGTLRARNGTELGNGLKALFSVPNVEYKPVRLFPRGIPVIDLIEVQIDGRLRGR